MSPLKRAPFFIIVTTINILFFLILAWWIWFILGSFRLMNTPLAPRSASPVTGLEAINSLINPSATPRANSNGAP